MICERFEREAYHMLGIRPILRPMAQALVSNPSLQEPVEPPLTDAPKKLVGMRFLPSLRVLSQVGQSTHQLCLTMAPPWSSKLAASIAASKLIVALVHAPITAPEIPIVLLLTA